MRSSHLYILSHILSLALTAFLFWKWYSAFYTLSAFDSRALLYIASAALMAFAAGIYFPCKKYMPALKIYPLLWLTLGGYFVLQLFWNRMFTGYILEVGYYQDVFRYTFQTFKAPVYGFIKLPGETAKEWLLLLAIPIVPLIALIYHRISPFLTILISGVALLFLITAFDQITFSKDLWLHDTHYDTFREGLPAFEGFREMLRYYVERMQYLGDHNNHYPPGNLLLLMLESRLFPGFAKGSVISATLLMLVPLYFLSGRSLTPNQTILPVILTATAPQFVIFPGNAMLPLVSLFAVGAIYFLTIYLQSKKIYAAIWYGVTIAIFTFFNFVVALIIIFSGALLLIYFVRKMISLKESLKFLAVSIGIFFLFYLLIYALFGFNIIACFIKSLEHNQQQMSTYMDDWSRYFLRSTGNILAYLFILGVPLLLLFIKSIKNMAFSRENISPFTVALSITILFAGFSGLFYLETERIWMILTPFVAIAAAPALQQAISGSGKMIFFAIILLQMVFIAVAKDWLWFV